ncbi:MAG: AAA family ATPase [Chthoniobacteraceae bacterium]
MDILDLVTDKAKLASAIEQQQRKTQTIDAPELIAYLQSKVIGQDKVAEDVAAQIRRRLLMKQRSKPIGVFCFAGPPGVGKTHFAKVLAEKLSGDRKALQFFDMAQYAEPHAASTLFGQGKGYVGSDRYGTLTAALRNFPKAVILLDEFEKSHSEVHKRFLTAWNDGFVTEASDGKRISTIDAIFILTTNAASETIGQLAASYADDRDMLVKSSKAALQEAGFAPEVLNRIDHVFAFRSLEGMDVARVVALEIQSLVSQFDLTICENGIDYAILARIVSRSEDLKSGGVRELSRVLEQELSDSIMAAKESGASVIRLTQGDGGGVVAEVVE